MKDEIKEIIEHLKEYLQSKIDNGEHKIFYNDLMWDEKTIDCINAIDDLLDLITNLKEENIKQKNKITKLNKKIKKAIKNCEECKEDIWKAEGSYTGYFDYIINGLKGSDN